FRSCARCWKRAGSADRHGRRAPVRRPDGFDDRFDRNPRPRPEPDGQPFPEIFAKPGPPRGKRCLRRGVGLQDRDRPRIMEGRGGWAAPGPAASACAFVQCAPMSASPDILPDLLRLSVAPMMDWTDTHCRVFHRLLAPHARLYTEMVHANAVIHGDRHRLLAMDPVEHPVALQLGGSEPGLLAQAAVIGAELGFDEVNLNCGCPSDRVQAGRFGACLMREPGLVAESVAAMIEAVSAL